MLTIDIIQPIPVDLVKWRQEIDNQIVVGYYPIELISLQNILTTRNTQSRFQLDKPTLDRYTELRKQGVALPPVILFFDGKDYRLVDGFHRYHAEISIDKTRAITGVIVPGNAEEATFYSLGANSAHGLPRKDCDVNYSVISLIAHPDWIKYSNVQAGIICGCSESLIRKIKYELTTATNVDELNDLAMKRGLNVSNVQQAWKNLQEYNRTSGGVVITKNGDRIDTSKIGKIREPDRALHLYVGIGAEGLATGERCEIKRIALEKPDYVFVTTPSNPQPICIPKLHLVPADSSDDTIRQGLIDACPFSVGEEIANNFDDRHTVSDIIPSVEPATQQWRVKLRVNNECGNTFDEDPLNFVSNEVENTGETSEPVDESESVLGTNNPHLDRRQLLFLGKLFDGRFQGYLIKDGVKVPNIFAECRGKAISEKLATQVHQLIQIESDYKSISLAVAVDFNPAADNWLSLAKNATCMAIMPSGCIMWFGDLHRFRTAYSDASLPGVKAELPFASHWRS